MSTQKRVYMFTAALFITAKTHENPNVSDERIDIGWCVTGQDRGMTF